MLHPLEIVFPELVYKICFSRNLNATEASFILSNVSCFFLKMFFTNLHRCNGKLYFFLKFFSRTWIATKGSFDFWWFFRERESLQRSGTSEGLSNHDNCFAVDFFSSSLSSKFSATRSVTRKFSPNFEAKKIREMFFAERCTERKRKTDRCEEQRAEKTNARNPGARCPRARLSSRAFSNVFSQTTLPEGCNKN